ncbi:MAG TPA: CRISPR-associated endonuclease Cas3'', partial [Magnetospirillum sp.]|nr:CRISPR-associated endonuclease Cas3'' [Magnetospirillum sp.]
MAAAFAEAFKAGAWGRAAGLLHDLGKACEAFQKRLRGAPAAVDHISAGVQAAARTSPLGKLLAYVVAGHHGGMPDAGELAARLARHAPYDEAALLPLPAFASPPARMAGQGAALFVRMIFSCLTDADFLATEAFYRPGLPRLRGTPFDAETLLARLSAYMDREIIKDAPPTAINQLRHRILGDCLRKAEAPAGLFTLSVPTGGGKTLAAMAFALAHAKRWGKRRVVTVIPYTSIIEQNAAIYRHALGAENVLEHHSAFRHPRDHDGPEPEAREKLRLAEENWDAPVVVTTSVQFFESLLSNRPSRCRKLHNLADAVIVLDEAQLLPTAFLEPCLHVLQALARDYGCTIVLATATQPALTDPAWLPRCALTGVTEIVEQP